MTIYQSGVSIFFPIYTIVDFMVGARIMKNNESESSASFIFNNNDLDIPSIVYTGIIGLSIHLFDIAN